MIIIWILDRVNIDLDEPSSYWYIAGFELLFIETPIVAMIIYWIRWKLSII